MRETTVTVGVPVTLTFTGEEVTSMSVDLSEVQGVTSDDGATIHVNGVEVDTLPQVVLPALAEWNDSDGFAWGGDV